MQTRATQLSILIPARNSAHCIENTVAKLEGFLATQLPELGYEILLLPNRADSENVDRTEEVARSIAVKSPRVRVVDQKSELGKGAAVRNGILHGRGSWILFMDSDLPFELSCITAALAELKGGADFVTVNRRLKESSFRCPVPLLHLVYRRHRLGIHFNRVVRYLLGISSTDTQAGLKAFSRHFAELAAAKQTCPNFFFDLEFFLIAQQHGFSCQEIPVEFRLESEKSTVTLFREFLKAVYWLPRIFVQKWLGRYSPTAPANYSAIAPYLPKHGHVLDFGAQSLKFGRGLEEEFARRPDCVTILDALHQLPFAKQEEIVSRTFEELKPGGVLLVREALSGAKTRRPFGFTKIDLRQPFSRTRDEWKELFRNAGFRVMSEQCSTLTDELFVAQRPLVGGESAPFALQVTADDWGLSPSVNDGILDLVDRGVVRRVSLMANGKYLEYRLGELLRSPARLGLHFDLTYGGNSPHFSSKGRLLRFLLNPVRSQLSKVSLISGELERQLGVLKSHGVRVEHLDGHHHVHIFPFVSSALREPLEKHGIDRVRLPYDKRLWQTTRFPLNVLSLLARSKFLKSGFISYPFLYPSAKDFRSEPSLALKMSSLMDTELIVHPAHSDDFDEFGVDDPLRKERVREYEFLKAMFPIRPGRFEHWHN